MKLKNYNIGYQIFLAGILLIAVGLPLSKTLITAGLLVLLSGWLASAEFKNKWNEFKGNRNLQVFLLIYLIHIIGLTYTTDFLYAFKDLRIKIPLLALPVLLATGPIIKPIDIKRLWLLFIAAVISSGFVSLWILIKYNPLEPRDLSPFISHIRLSLMICFAIFLSGWLIIKELKKRYEIIVLVLVFFLLLMYIFLLEALTGILLFSLLTPFVLGFIMLRSKKKKVKIISFVALATVFTLLIISILNIRNEFFPDLKEQINTIEDYTAEGNPYVHDTLSILSENGNLVWLNLCEKELRREWNKRCTTQYDSIIVNEYSVKDVLIRYLASKGLKKDAEGINALTENDFKNIERGVTNYLHANRFSINIRLDQLKWEYWSYVQSKDPCGSTIMQRFELWKNSMELIRDNPVFGVGTGDLKNSFAKQLESADSTLQGSNLRSHNQYFAITIAFGIPGLLLFLIAILYPQFYYRGKTNFVHIIFLLIMLLSMISEDTLESQVGVTLFSLFYSILFLRRVDRDNVSGDT